MKRLCYVIALAGIFFKSYALDEALKPVKQAIVRADVAFMTNWLKNCEPLEPEDKKELLAAAEKWEKLRKTILTPFDRGKIYGGIAAIAGGFAPLLICLRFPMLIALIDRNAEVNKWVLLACAGWAAYWSLTGGSTIYAGWNAGGTRIYEKNAKAIVLLIKKAPVVQIQTTEEPGAQEVQKEDGGPQ